MMNPSGPTPDPQPRDEGARGDPFNSESLNLNRPLHLELPADRLMREISEGMGRRPREDLDREVLKTLGADWRERSHALSDSFDPFLPAERRLILATMFTPATLASPGGGEVANGVVKRRRDGARQYTLASHLRNRHGESLVYERRGGFSHSRLLAVDGEAPVSVSAVVLTVPDRERKRYLENPDTFPLLVMTPMNRAAFIEQVVLIRTGRVLEPGSSRLITPLWFEVLNEIAGLIRHTDDDPGGDQEGGSSLTIRDIRPFPFPIDRDEVVVETDRGNFWVNLRWDEGARWDRRSGVECSTERTRLRRLGR